LEKDCSTVINSEINYNRHFAVSCESLSEKTMLDVSTQSGCTESTCPVLNDQSAVALLKLLQCIKDDLNPQGHVKDIVT
jgi:hypothetical protein